MDLRSDARVDAGGSCCPADLHPGVPDLPARRHGLGNWVGHPVDLRMDPLPDPLALPTEVPSLPLHLARSPPAPLQEREVLVRGDDACRRPRLGDLPLEGRSGDITDLPHLGGRTLHLVALGERLGPWASSAWISSLQPRSDSSPYSMTAG